jgi:hypothetical protein
MTRQRAISSLLLIGGLFLVGYLLHHFLNDNAAAAKREELQRPAVKDSDLFHAVMCGNEAEVSDLLRRGANVNATLEGTEITPLFVAIYLRQDRIARILLSHENSNIHRSFCGYTAQDVSMHIFSDQDPLTNRLAPESMVQQQDKEPVDLNRSVYVASGEGVLSKDPGTASAWPISSQPVRSSRTSRLTEIKSGNRLIGYVRSAAAFSRRATLPPSSKLRRYPSTPVLISRLLINSRGMCLHLIPVRLLRLPLPRL